jgi:hypothetical protein
MLGDSFSADIGGVFDQFGQSVQKKMNEIARQGGANVIRLLPWPVTPSFNAGSPNQ